MENIPCKFLAHWTENQSPLGSGLNWPMHFSDCGHPELDSTSKQEEFEAYAENNECSPECPGYEPLEVSVCDKHGEFLKASGCDGCMYDSYLECKKSGDEYYSQLK